MMVHVALQLIDFRNSFTVSSKCISAASGSIRIRTEIQRGPWSDCLFVAKKPFWFKIQLQT